MMIKILDEGFVELIDHMGNDNDIANAARVSFGNYTDSPQKNTNLINYLMKHQHMTPFEMVEMKFRIKLPIFIMRQLVRHRTANINEISGRYVELERDFYVPDVKHINKQSSSNKQGRGGMLPSSNAEEAAAFISEGADVAFDCYDKLLRMGIAKEIARIMLPASTYTEIIFKCDLRNLFNLIKLRQAPNAQLEMRLYADAIAKFIEEKFPKAYAAFVNYEQDSVKLSASQVAAINDMINGKLIQGGLSDREYKELSALFIDKQQ